MADGFLLINKPPGPTSHDIVEEIRFLAEGSKVGHAGTLDPFAEGLLIILVGDYTKLAEEFMKFSKEYRAVLRMGADSDTNDAEGNILLRKEITVPGRQDIEGALEKFRGEILQIPPQFSALKVSGKRAYREARAGREVNLVARKVNVMKLETVWYGYPLLTLDVTVSSGTYIRALARDIGEMLSTGAMLISLRREAVGKYHLEDAVDFRTLTSKNWQEHIRTREVGHSTIDA